MLVLENRYIGGGNQEAALVPAGQEFKDINITLYAFDVWKPL